MCFPPPADEVARDRAWRASGRSVPERRFVVEVTGEDVASAPAERNPRVYALEAAASRATGVPCRLGLGRMMSHGEASLIIESGPDDPPCLEVGLADGKRVADWIFASAEPTLTFPVEVSDRTLLLWR